MTHLPTMLDLRDRDLLEWIGSADRTAGDQIALTYEAEIQAQQFILAATTSLPGDLGEHVIVTAIRREYLVLREGQPFSDLKVLMPLGTRIAVRASAVLAVERHMPADAVDFAKAAMAAFDGKSNLEAFIASKVSEFNSRGGYQFQDGKFKIFFQPTYTWIRKRLDDAQDKWLRNVYQGDGHSSLPDLVPREGDNLGTIGYTLRFMRDTYLAEYSPPAPGSSVIDSPAGVIGNPQKEREVVRDRALEDARKLECDPMEPEVLRLTSIWLPDETKFVLEMVYYEFGCGGGMHIPTPVQYRRGTEQILYVSCTYRKMDERLKNVFLSSLKEAALLGIVIAVVFSNEEEGKATFKAEFWRLIKERLGETVECLIPDLKVVKQTSEWIRVGGFST